MNLKLKGFKIIFEIGVSILCFQRTPRYKCSVRTLFVAASLAARLDY